MGCPVSMTYAAVPALRPQPDVAAVWEPLAETRVYDPGLRPHNAKAGVLFGMAMTEKQGGSDVRANTTVAEAVAGGGPGGEYRITGHKWFCSAPMCDAFLVLAQAPRGLSCFLLPRVLPDGTRNAFHIQRLKDKLGNRSNVSSEVEFEDASASLLGEEGRGVHVIVEMVNSTRLDCIIGSASLMRQAVVQAIHHASHRNAFGRLLRDQPLMQNVLADLALESEAATTLMLRLAASERSSRRRARGVVQTHRCRRWQVLGVQAHARDGGRSPRMPGRERLRRGIDHAPASARGAAEFNLGRVRECRTPLMSSGPWARTPTFSRPIWLSWMLPPERMSVSTSSSPTYGEI